MARKLPKKIPTAEKERVLLFAFALLLFYGYYCCICLVVMTAGPVFFLLDLGVGDASTLRSGFVGLRQRCVHGFNRLAAIEELSED